MTFRINASGHHITTAAGTEEVSEKDFWAALKRQVKAMPHNRGAK